MANQIGFFAMLQKTYDAVGTIATAVGTTASAVNRGASALDNLGRWAEVQTEGFVNEAQFENQIKMDELKLRRLKYQQQLAVLDNAATPALAN